MIEILDLKSCKPMVLTSTPSITIAPLAASTILNKEEIKLDLPHPVLPTIPIFLQPL